MRRSELERRAAAATSGSTVTLEMVAREAGVSPSTVSRILNGTARVRDAKVRAVEAAIARLQFVPNPVARSLAGGRSMSVGVVTQAIDSPFYCVALASIEQRLLQDKYSPLFVSGHWSDSDERRCVDHLLGRRVEGIILLNSRLQDSELTGLARSVPLVVTGRRIAGERLYCLDFDNTMAARIATDYLIQQGHRRIAFVSGPADHPDALQRLAGYKTALAAAGIPFAKQLVVAGDYMESGGLAAIAALLDARVEFSAVFAANDQTAYGAMLGLYRRGLRVPGDVSVVGFDDLPTSAFVTPPLTSVRRFTDRIGAAAAEAMVDLIERRTPQAATAAPTLAIRESTRAWRE